MNHHLRYWLFQVPGLALAVLVGGSLYYFKQISLQTAWIIVGAWVLKDLLLYPLLVNAYRVSEHKTEVNKMIGMIGVVRQELQPKGLIQIRGERWRAVSATQETIPASTEVKVVDAERLTLFVTPVDRT